MNNKAVKDLVFKELKLKTQQKFDENSNVYNIGIDSLDLVELITDAEDKLNIQISDDELQKIKSVGDIISAIENKVKAS